MSWTQLYAPDPDANWQGYLSVVDPSVYQRQPLATFAIANLLALTMAVLALLAIGARLRLRQPVALVLALWLVLELLRWAAATFVFAEAAHTTALDWRHFTSYVVAGLSVTPLIAVLRQLRRVGHPHSSHRVGHVSSRSA